MRLRKGGGVQERMERVEQDKRDVGRRWTWRMDEEC